MAIKETGRIPRVLVAKIGLDGHNRGAQVVAYGLRDAGMEVIYTGIRQTPTAVARTAVQEDVDVIGISSMVGAHVSVMKKLRKELSSQGALEIPVILGGIVPEEDYEALHSLGVGAIYPPGSNVSDMVQYINKVVKEKAWVSEVPGTLVGKDIESLRLLGSRCEKCNGVYFPAKKNCPRCLDDKHTKQMPMSDQGVLQTFSIAQVAPPGYPVPHGQGYIDLDEDGPRIFSLLSDYGDGSSLKTNCKMGLKIARLGRDKQDRVIVGYRFRPL